MADVDVKAGSDELRLFHCAPLHVRTARRELLDIPSCHAGDAAECRDKSSCDEINYQGLFIFKGLAEIFLKRRKVLARQAHF